MKLLLISLVPGVFADKPLAQYGGGYGGWGMGPGMMGWGYYGMGWIGMIIMIAFWVAVIVGIVFLIRWIIHSTGSSIRKGDPEDSPLEILRRRYARGEIQKEEFEIKKKDLGY
jgi:putative membrane protein